METMIRKFVLSVLVSLLGLGVGMAQEMAQATDVYNNGVAALQIGNNNNALECFQKALAMGEKCGEEGLELVNNCKNVIPNIILSVAKELIKNDSYEPAIIKLKEARQIAEKYENEKVLDESKSLIPQVYMKKANNDLKTKKFEQAADGYLKVIALDSTNGMAALRLGQTFASMGNIAKAEEAFLKAAKYGQESTAKKQLSKIQLKIAASSLKKGQLVVALEAANKANTYCEDAQAYYIAGQAAQKLGKEKDAIEYFCKHLELKPVSNNSNAVAFTIAVLSQKHKDKARAKVFYQKVLSDPRFGVDAKKQIEILSK